jgi:protein SCO1/2
MSAPEKPQKQPLHPLSIWIPIILIMLGLVVFWNYMVKLQTDSLKPQLPKLTRLEKNFTFTERSGQEVELKELKGKVILACWVFTRCPRGCPGVVAEMMKLQKEFGDNPDIHFLTASVDPDDKAEDLRKFTENFGIQAKNWWFVTGPKDGLRVLMTKYFGFQDVQDVPEADRLTPDDKFLHDMKVALVDHQGHVRGLYDIASADPEFAGFFREKIRTDIKTLLEDQKNAR